MAPQQTLVGNPAAYGEQCKKRPSCWTWEPIFLVGMLAEFFGTFFVTFFAGAALSLLYYLSGQEGCCAAGRVEAALASGLAYYAVSKAFGWLRGPSFNPVVTLALMIMRRIPPLYALLCWIGQFAGAILGGALLWFFFGAFEPTIGTPVPMAGFSEGRAFFLEAIAVFFIVLFVLAREKCGGFCAATYGATITVASFVLIQFTGASLNPARQLGQAVFSGVWTSHWVYWLSSFVAAALAALTFMLAFDAMKLAVIEQKIREKSIRK
jgi:glycerol uptake facilitator-like aquaporin